MAGTLFGIPLSQNVDSNGRPLSGCLLYIYEAGTSTPVTPYEDFGLTTGLELPNPIEADSSGRIPQFWLADGAYRVRLTTSAGVEVYDYNSIQAIGASSGEGGGGGGVSASAIFQTGDPIWVPASGVRTGWVRLNGRTIGSASSAATERANADTEDLFTVMWGRYSNTICAVSGGRGANAAADFAANKTLTLLDMRAAAGFGLNDMGNSDGGWLTDFDIGNGTTPGSSGGNNLKTILQANLPSYNLDVSGLNIKYSKRNDASVSGAQDMMQSISSGGSTTSSGGVTGTLPSGGSGTAIDIMPFFFTGTWYIKL